MSKSDSEKDYEVGYGKPPKATRFKKGQSGNSKGRPKGANGFNASLKRELESKVTVRMGTREVKISKAEAAAKRLVESALKGDMKALSMLARCDADVFGHMDPGADGAAPSGMPEPVEYAILRDYFSKSATVDGDAEDREANDVGS